jgi:hypothetical protein
MTLPLYARSVATKTKTALVLLAVGVAIVLGRWPVHWHAHPLLAALSAIVIAAVVGGLLTVRTARAALPAAALLCLVDAAMLIRRWSVHLPIHCSCLPKSGGPAILGVGGLSFLADLALAGLAFWVSRGWRRS